MAVFRDSWAALAASSTALCVAAPVAAVVPRGYSPAVAYRLTY